MDYSYSQPEFHHRRKSRAKRLKLLSNFTTLILIGLVGFVLFLVGSFVYLAKDLPSPNKLSNTVTEEQSTKIFDRNGVLLYDIYANSDRTLVTLDRIPKYLQQATIATEDKNFYNNKGFDPTAYIRIPFDLLIHHQLIGGSTLTQQLVKMTFLSPERTPIRKLKELFLAIEVDSRYSKNDILQMYLNEAPYGGAAIGVEAASQQYFGKHVQDLSLAESAVLAGLPQSPTYYSPLGENPSAYKDRTAYVLRRMREDKYITSQQEKDALAQIQNSQIKFQPEDVSIKAPHFVMYVKEQLVKEYGEKVVEQGGLHVTTTLDYNVQQIAQSAVTEEVSKLKSAKVGNGAAIVMDPKTGDVLAMVGGKDYFGKSEPAGCTEGSNCTFESNVNLATSLRQPGSATKPITYSVGFKKGYSPSSVLMDVPTVFQGQDGQPDYKPVNYDAKWHGPTPIRYALGNSYNIPAVKMLAIVGIKPVMQQAFDMGITNWEPTSDNLQGVGLSLVLGGRELTLLQLTNAYATFAAQGVKHDPVSILKVTDAKDQQVYFEQKQNSGKEVLPKTIAFLISHILSDNSARTAEFGANNSLVVSGYTVAAKTGTTDSKKDNWTMGYTPSYVVGVWVGNNDSEPMDPRISSGVTGAAPIWNRIMKNVLQDKPKEDFSNVPDGVVAMQVDALTGGLPKDNNPTRSDYFLKGTEPTQVSSDYQTFNVCTSSPTNYGTDDDVSHGKTQPKDLVAFAESDPVSTDGKNRWQDGINQWVFGQPDDHLKAPYIKGCDSTVQRPLVVSITNIPNGANVAKHFDVTVGAQSQDFTVLKITASVDGKTIKEITSQPYAFHVDVPQGGDHTLQVDAVDSGGNTDSQSITVHANL